MKPQMLFVVALGFVLTACSATELRPQAQRIRMTNTEPTGCRYLGEVIGNQGGSFAGKYTSNTNLETGARNDMKNKASDLGGNVIVMLANRAGQTGSYGLYGGSSQQTNVTYVGAVYKCKSGSGLASSSKKPTSKKG
jgi:hypothetical protein